MLFVVLFMLFDVMLYVFYQILWRNMQITKQKKNWHNSISDRVWLFATVNCGRRYLFVTSAKNNSDQKQLVAERVSATGWRHSATGDVIGWVSATTLSATGVSATGIDFLRPDRLSETGAWTFSYRKTGRWKYFLL